MQRRKISINKQCTTAAPTSSGAVLIRVTVSAQHQVEKYANTAAGSLLVVRVYEEKLLGTHRNVKRVHLGILVGSENHTWGVKGGQDKTV